jgi:putative two-component system response regulator
MREDHILIVDDEERICRILSRRLSKEGYCCVTANSGQEALHLIQSDYFSLMISDIKMPQMDGMTLLKRVKDLHPKIVAIMATAYAEIDYAVEAMRMGARDFLVKPIDLNFLVMSVKKALEKRQLEDRIEAYQLNLEQLVETRTEKLQHALKSLRKAQLDSLKILIGAIEAKDPYTRGHSERVSRMVVQIGKKLNLKGQRLETLEYGALLHDIGKIGIRESVLQKKGPLTPEEYCHVQEHSLIAVKILEGVDFFKETIPMIHHHHEHVDGGGYPDGLIGESIPLEARIIAVADAFDAMTSVRPHRGQMSVEDTLREMRRFKGRQFDSGILDILLGGNG